MLNPMRDKDWRHVRTEGGRRRDETSDHSLSRSGKVQVVRWREKGIRRFRVGSTGMLAGGGDRGVDLLTDRRP